MSKAKEEWRDLNHAVPFDFNQMMDRKFEPIIKGLAAEVIQWSEIQVRPSGIASTERAVSCLLANLSRAHLKHPDCFLAAPMDAASLTESRYRRPGFGYTHYRRVVEYLAEVGLIKRSTGFFDRTRNAGKVTRLIGTEELINRLVIDLSSHQATQGKDLKGTSLITSKISPSWSDIQPTRSFEEVHLRDELKRPIDYQDSDATKAMRKNLIAWNSFYLHHWVDLYLTDEQVSQPLKPDAVSEEHERYRYPGLDLTRAPLYRIFSRGSFDLGGRFYGGWWQLLPSEFRPYITIDWHPTRELDYANMLPAMLYAQEGMKLEGEAYAIDEIEVTYRPLIKQTFLQLINALEGQRIQAPRPEELPPETSWEDFQQLIRSRHEPIEKHFRTGVGLSLQRKDSDIAEAVMLTMMQRGILVLPVHDSFVVRDGHYLALRDTMLEVYEKVMGQPIGTTLDGSFKDQGLAEKAGTPPISSGVDEILKHAEEEKRFEEKRYAAYMERKRSILRTWDEDQIADINPKLP